MKKIVPFSILSLTLLAVSAVAATILLGKAKNLKHENSADNGTMRSVSGIGGASHTPPIFMCG